MKNKNWTPIFFIFVVLLLCSSMSSIRGSGPPLFLIILALLQVVVFLVALFLVGKVWLTVIDFVRNTDLGRGRILASIIGNATTQGNTGKSSIKAAGISLGLTVSILLVAVAAIYVIGDQHVVR